MTDGPRASVLLVTGTLGAGKSAVADEIHEQLCVADFRHALIDFDYFGSTWPRSTDLGFRNLRAVWANYAAADFDRLVIATTLRSREYLEGIRASIPGSTITVCLLRAPEATLQDRLRTRTWGRTWRATCATQFTSRLFLIWRASKTSESTARRGLCPKSRPRFSNGLAGSGGGNGPSQG